MEQIICTKENGIGIIALDRPKALNALNTQMYHDILEAVALFEADKEVKVVIITGSTTRAFAAGADIAEMQSMGVVEAGEFVNLANRAFFAIEEMTKPVFAAVEGYALGGGCELSLVCDIRFAGKSAKFGVPEMNLGIVPGIGGTQRLPRVVGKAKAMELILTGKNIGAEEALQLGMVSYVTEDGEALNAAKELAAQICAKGQEAVQTAKAAVNIGLNMDMRSAVRYENALFSRLFGTEDQKEGMAAFLEKRKANFQDK